MPAYSSRYADALSCGAQWHADQFRKGSPAPYIAHLIAVSALVWRYGGDEDAAIAGVLHDAVEDTGGMARAAEIEHRFGPVVVGIVLASSDSVTDDAGNKAPWRERKEHHIAAAAELAASGDTQACLVMACDKLDNLYDLVGDLKRRGDEVWSLYKGSPEDTLWYYGSMLSAVSPAIPAGLAAELGRMVDELGEFV